MNHDDIEKRFSDSAGYTRLESQRPSEVAAKEQEGAETWSSVAARCQPINSVLSKLMVADKLILVQQQQKRDVGMDNRNWTEMSNASGDSLTWLDRIDGSHLTFGHPPDCSLRVIAISLSRVKLAEINS